MLKALIVVFAVVLVLYALVSVIKFIVSLVQRKKAVDTQKVESASETHICVEEEKSEKEV